MIFSDARLCLVDLMISSIFSLLLVMVVHGWALVAPPLCLPTSSAHWLLVLVPLLGPEAAKTRNMLPLFQRKFPVQLTKIMGVRTVLSRGCSGAFVSRINILLLKGKIFFILKADISESFHQIFIKWTFLENRH